MRVERQRLRGLAVRIRRMTQISLHQHEKTKETKIAGFIGKKLSSLPPPQPARPGRRSPAQLKNRSLRLIIDYDTEMFTRLLHSIDRALFVGH